MSGNIEGGEGEDTSQFGMCVWILVWPAHLKVS